MLRRTDCPNGAVAVSPPRQGQLPILVGEAEAGLDQIEGAESALERAQVEQPQRLAGGRRPRRRRRRRRRRRPDSQGIRQRHALGTVVPPVEADDVSAGPEEEVGKSQLGALHVGDQPVARLAQGAVVKATELPARAGPHRDQRVDQKALAGLASVQQRQAKRQGIAELDVVGA